MAIPAFQDCMLPLLLFLADDNEHTNTEIVSHISDYFGLTEEERNMRIPSGPQYLIYSRVYWAKTYLKKAKLIEETSKSVNVLTKRGHAVLNEKPERVDVKYLLKFKEFKDYRNANKDKSLTPSTSDFNDKPIVNQEMTPEDSIIEGTQKLKSSIIDDLLDQIKENTPRFFENLVVQLLVKMGYGGSFDEAAQVVGKTGDGGIDGVIKEDRLGLDLVYVQAKRWQNNIGSPEIQGFVGALAGKKSKKGIFITTSTFTKAALEYAKTIEHNIVLIDGKKFAELMFEFNLGVTVQKVLEIKVIDSDFFHD